MAYIKANYQLIRVLEILHNLKIVELPFQTKNETFSAFFQARS